MKETLLIALCILLYGSATFFKRLGLAQLHPYQFLMTSSTCYALVIPVWYYLSINSGIQTSYNWQNISLVVIYSSFSLLAGVVLAFLLQKTSTPGSLIIMTNLSSLVTLALTCVFLKEQLNLTKIIAVILAILSLILINY